MNLKIVDFETAKELKELEFDWRVECAYLYDKSNLLGNKEEYVAFVYKQNHNSMGHRFSAPTQAEVVKWLRDEKGLLLIITRCMDENLNLKGLSPYAWGFDTEQTKFDDIKALNGDRKEYDSYEQAELAGIKKAIKILKERQNEYTN